MQWIKRNLFLVLGGVVALALLGVAGAYLYQKIQQDSGVTAELDTATERLKTLANRDPHPGTPQVNNIAAAKEEEQRLVTFLKDVAKYFVPPPYPAEIGNKEFRTSLVTTVDYLRGEAKRAGVEIPTNYWFSFDAHKGTMAFKPESLQPLASQLGDVRAISEVLFDAKINKLVSIKRTSVEKEDSTTATVFGVQSQDYITTKPITNTWTVVAPYEVVFQGFSAQLASVLEGLVRVPHCLLVTNIVVQPAAEVGMVTEETTSTDPAQRYAPIPTSDPMARYGGRYGGAGRYGGGRYGRAPVVIQAPQPVAQAPRGPVNALEEKPLQFTLALQVVKLKPQTVASK